MNTDILKAKAKELISSVPYLGHIKTEEEYHKAIELMEELIEDYEESRPLIELLSIVIERWEDQAEQFSAFNKRIARLDSGIAVLQTLIDQYSLRLSDFKNEIGGKGMVSMVLSGERNLSVKHIKALSQRFNLSPALFF